MTSAEMDPQRTIVTSCGVVLDDARRVLFMHRRADRPRWPDLWYLPGGEAEDGEDVDDTLVRELEEEIGVRVRESEFIDTLFDEEPRSGRRAVHNIYLVRAFDGQPGLLAPDEHDALDWLTPAQMAERAVPAALRSLLHELLGVDAPRVVDPVDMPATWDAISSHYQEQAQIPTDRIHYGATTPMEDELRLVGDPAGRDIVEVGCGGGQNAIAFKKQGARRVVGFDASAEQLGFAAALAGREGVEVEFVRGWVEDMRPLPDAAFDAAYSSYCFQFVADIAATFQAVHRVLRAGGRFAFCLDHPAYMLFGDDSDGRSMTKSYFQREAEWIWPFETGYAARMTAVYHTIGDLFAALRGAGFVVEQLLEPEPTGSRTGSWSENAELSKHVPRTVIFAARKPERGEPSR